MFWIVCIVGFILRSYQLTDQILWDDEWHAIFNVRDYSLWDNATYFRESDNCTPLTIFYQILAKTVGLNEFGLRIVPFLAGLCTIFFCYWAVKRIFDKKTALIFTALIGISPLLIYYSRYARPYSIVALLSFTAVVAFYAWIKTEKKFYGAVYIFTAVVAPYFNLFALTAVVAPLGLSLCLSLLRKIQRKNIHVVEVPSLRRLLKVGVMVVLGISVWLAPLLPSLTEMGSKMHGGYSTADSFLNMLSLFSGTGDYFFIGVLIILFIYGAICLYRENIFIFLTIFTMVFLQCLVTMITMPKCIEVGIVLARYGISLLLFWLLVIALAVRNLCTRYFLTGRVKGRPIAASLGVGIFIAVLFLKGPLPATYYFPNDFTNHAYFQYDYRKKVFSPSDLTIPEMRFYTSLKSQPGVRTIVEYPYTYPRCMYSWGYNPYHYYQRVHGKKVIMGEDPGILAGFRKNNIRIRNCIDIADPNSWRKMAGYLVIHKNILRESIAIGWGNGDLMCNKRFFDANYQARMRTTVVRLRNILGQPLYEDEHIAVFAPRNDRVLGVSQ